VFSVEGLTRVDALILGILFLFVFCFLGMKCSSMSCSWLDPCIEISSVVPVSITGLLGLDLEVFLSFVCVLMRAG
jgi:hypothetical protein